MNNLRRGTAYASLWIDCGQRSDETKSSIDLWLKDIAPTTELGKWFGHDPTNG